ncbi:unnamed protein product [Cyclocybe aegerita]|uniref:Uncharacterized protein n=1 Tax=Cyclocybe aegerita TaxID=1973307 RepID=A0A8S0WVA7_CYCAE|nr:unnamed protein product [Cyclocybe aegerita]
MLSTLLLSLLILTAPLEIYNSECKLDPGPSALSSSTTTWTEFNNSVAIALVYQEPQPTCSCEHQNQVHKYVTELKVRVGCRKTDNSIDMLRSRAAHSVLDSWSSTFQDPTYWGSEFLELQWPDGQPIQPSYLNGGPWILTFKHSITEFARVCWCITGHVPIGVYYCHFKINEPHSCTCGAALQSRQHILFRCCDRYSVHYPRENGDIASFMKHNPMVFGFNQDPSGVGKSLWAGLFLLSGDLSVN